MITALTQWLTRLQRIEDYEREAYLSQATDIADLERRIRTWERNAQRSFDCGGPC